jgi:pyruvate formate lyase activating enzyme
VDSPVPRYWEEADSGIRCLLCPHRCSVYNGKAGLCKVRKAEENRLSLPYYGALSGAAMDPIEKKPLYHFFPGSRIMSVGFFGCNLRCPFCQNFSISQRVESGIDSSSPESAVKTAIEAGSFGLAYTYSEPLVHFEYVLDTSIQAKKSGLKNVLVTNGYINQEPARELLEVVDAANVDLKAWSDELYKAELGGSLQPVLDFISLASSKIHLEVTTLVIPGKNSSVGEIDSIARFLSELNRDIPLHLSCYFPRYRYSVRPTTYSDLEPLMAAARRHLHYVYAGNTAEGNDTLCPTCGETLIQRSGYQTVIKALKDGRCSSCGVSVPIRRA